MFSWSVNFSINDFDFFILYFLFDNIVNKNIIKIITINNIKINTKSFIKEELSLSLQVPRLVIK